MEDRIKELELKTDGLTDEVARLRADALIAQMHMERLIECTTALALKQGAN